MTNILYRKETGNATLPHRNALVICLAILCLAIPGFSQYRRPRQPVRTSPRAVAVLEIMPTGSPHLYPVSLMLEGKFYDASLYAANPVPLALDSGTVYEAQKDGMPVGMFTVSRAGKMENTWWGEGRWKPFAPEEDAAAKPAAKPGDKSGKSDAKDGKPAPTKASSAEDDPDRPILRKPKAEPSPAPQATVNVPAPTTPAEQKREIKEADEDPNRPMLRRGRPSDVDTEEPLPTSPIAGGGLPGKTPAKAKGKPTATFVAVSDAAPYDNRPFDFQESAAEQEHLTKLASDIAIAELRKFASGSGRQLPQSMALTDVQLRYYDLDYSNAPYVILSGQYLLPAAPAKAGSIAGRDTTFYITVVTRMDTYGNLNKVMAVATDSLHLDAYPKLELVDAIDVDGDGRGELLFRQINDDSRSYVVYRVMPFQTAKLFEGGSGQ